MNNLAKKNIIVLKDIPSNIIDEAIIILKDNKLKQKRYKNTTQPIINDINETIFNYINNKEINKISRENLIRKNKKLKTVILFLVIGLIAMYILK